MGVAEDAKYAVKLYVRDPRSRSGQNARDPVCRSGATPLLLQLVRELFLLN
jgi:hypothetical protein